MFQSTLKLIYTIVLPKPETPTPSHSTPKKTRTRTQTSNSISQEPPSPLTHRSTPLNSPFKNKSKSIKDKENVPGDEGPGKMLQSKRPRSNALRRSAENEHEREQPPQLFADNTNTASAFALELSPILEDLAVFDSMPSLGFDTLDLGLGDVEQGLAFPPPHPPNSSSKPSLDEHSFPEPTLTLTPPISELGSVSVFESESVQYPASKSTSFPSFRLGLGNDFARDESERPYQELVPPLPTMTNANPSFILQRPSLDEHHLPALTLTKPTPELGSVPVFESVSVTLSPMLKPVNDSDLDRDSVSSLMLQPPSPASSRSSLSLPRLPPHHGQPQPRNRDTIPPPQAPRCTSCGFGFGLGFGSELELSRMPCEMCEEQWVRWVGWYGYGYGERTAKEDKKKKKNRKSWLPLPLPGQVSKTKSGPFATEARIHPNRNRLSLGIRKRLSVLVTTSTVTRVDEDRCLSPSLLEPRIRRITWRRRFSSSWAFPNKDRKRFSVLSLLASTTKDSDLKNKRYSSVGVQTQTRDQLAVSTPLPLSTMPPPQPRPRISRDSRFIEHLVLEEEALDL
ncbi:hypothetical protein Moror_2826 [Moniliophthora roreri MCA 2997]|uniref:Uncharacterized protein n=1 Tax=Moniliophthora roreri (strain MCA 2997) TaxID=1381753 RepID=V2XC72_MONRO|nr:hypothetical protein Moror_2826 [Moniliophthora roreri MCA 2997]